MDKDKKRARTAGSSQDETVRMHAVSSDMQETRPHQAPAGQRPRQQTMFDMDKLRRDLEDSKRLHDEARRRKQEAQTKPGQPAQSKQTPQSARAQAAPRASQVKPAAAPQSAEKAAAEEAARRQAKQEAARAKRAQAREKAAALAGAASARAKAHRAKAAKKPLRERKGCGCLLYLILFCVIIGVAFATLWMVRAHNAATPIQDIPASQQAAVAQERERSNVYLLLAGTDQRADEASRSDTIIYAALRPVDRKIEMVSIPRDSLVEIPGVGEDKINAALAYGGMDLLVDTVENLVDNPVDHTVMLNFQSFEKIIDAMGGIRINVEEDMYLPEEGIDLKAGEQKLNGHDALAFVRWRGDGTGDIGRMERQSEFMQALTEKVRHLTPWRAVMTAWTAYHEIKTDLSAFDMLRLAWDFIGMSGDALEYQHFEYETPYINGISYVLLNDQSVSEVVQLMKYGIVLEGQEDGTGYGYGYDDSGMIY